MQMTTIGLNRDMRSGRQGTTLKKLESDHISHVFTAVPRVTHSEAFSCDHKCMRALCILMHDWIWSECGLRLLGQSGRQQVSSLGAQLLS